MRTAKTAIASLIIGITTIIPLCIATDNNSVLDACGANGEKCSMEKGINSATNGVIEIIKNQDFSGYIQGTLLPRALGFLGIIAVIFIIYAGFLMLNSQGKDDGMKKGKTIITQVIMGIAIIFFAYAIVLFVTNLLSSRSTSYIPNITQTAIAADSKVNFNSYKKELENIRIDIEAEQKVNGELSTQTLAKVARLVENASKTLPDNDNSVFNTNIKKKITTSIKLIEKYPESDTYVSDLVSGLDDFINKIKIPQISAKINVSPASTGNAPFTASLRATEVIDPTGNSISESNYSWYIKDSKGVRKNVGSGPSIPLLFKKEGSYFIFLEIVSSRRNAAGFLDVIPFNQSVKIDVGPSIGSIKLYINRTNATDVDSVKITPGAGRAGVFLDASGSFPTKGTTFRSTTWDFGNGNRTTYSGSPKAETQYYQNEGTYDIKLTLETNELQKIEKQLRIIVKKPIASISSTKTTGFIGEEFKFTANSYLEQDRAFSYLWEIQDLSNDKIIYKYTHPNMGYIFKKLGRYNVRLTTNSPSGERDTDTFTVIIEGRGPKAIVEATRINKETPNVFFIDGSKSYNQDFDNSELSYKWSIDGVDADLINPTRGGAVGKYTFNTLGTHKISLEVQSADGKTGITTKEVEVTSLLSAKLVTNPKVANVGASMSFIADSKNATAFEWDFGDGETATTTTGRTSHTYKKAGKFTVTLGVRNGNDSNTISRYAYVKNSDSPFGVIKIKKDSDEIVPTKGLCNGEDAFLINRSDTYTMDAGDSINVDGTKENLSYYWTILDKSSSQSSFTYKFSDIGCFPVKLTVKDKKNNKTVSAKGYVKVENMAPQIAGLTITTPNKESDPVVVNITANNATDPDGVITSYLWYYYTDGDPEPQGFKVTSKPNTTFVMPKMPNEFGGGYYYFNVVAEDSNGAKTNLEESSGEKYSIPVFTGDNVNIPLITLKTSNTSIAVGGDVKFDATVKNFLGKELKNNIEYKWDFDGDGFYDKSTTEGSITYKFQKPGVFTSKVKVINKGVSNTKSQLITVKNVLKPDFKSIIVGEKVVLLNTTSGLYSDVKWKIGDTTSTNPYFFVQDYTKNGDFPSSITLDVSDGQDFKTTTKTIKKDSKNSLVVRKMRDNLIYFTYPEETSGTIRVKDSNSKVFIYLGESKGTISKYVIDSDTSVDSDLNGSKDDDEDNKNTESYNKGNPFVLKDFGSRSKESTIRLTTYDENGKAIQSKDIKLILDFIEDTKVFETKLSGTISEIDNVNLEKLKTLIKEVPEKDRLTMMGYYNKLKENWFDTTEKTKTIIDFESYIENESPLDDQKKNEFYNILEGFIVSGGQMTDSVSVAAGTLRGLIPANSPNYEKITSTLDEILSHPTNIDENKKLAQQIWDLVRADSTIDDNNKKIIQAQLNTIINSAKAPEGANIKESEKTQTDNGEGGGIGGLIGNFVKIILAIFGLIAAIFGGLFIYFKTNNKDEELGFQDFIIEKFLSGKASNINHKNDDYIENDILSGISIQSQEEEKNQSSAQNDIKEEKEEEDSSVPDWLKGSSSNQAEETNTIEESPKEEEDSSVPDWLKGIPNEEETSIQNENYDSTPDWLKQTNVSETIQEDNEVIEEETKEDIMETPKEQEEQVNNEISVESEEKEEVINSTNVNEDNNDSDLPDWLKGIDSNSLQEELEEELTSNNNEAPKEETINIKPKKKSTPKKTKKEETSSSDNKEDSIDDLPDWLKGSVLGEDDK